MKHTEYSDKEKSIFDGILDLLNKGYKIHELKVADIAASAGIGKSTAYEYFSNKEEIIRQAVVYHIHKEYERFSSLISNESSFEGTVDKILDYTANMIKSRFYGLLFMVLNLGQCDITQLLCKDSDLIAQIRLSIDEQVLKMFKMGKNENLIGDDIDVEDLRLVLQGMISAYANEVVFMVNKPQVFKTACINENNIDLRSDKHLAELKERLVKIILKALN